MFIDSVTTLISTFLGTLLGFLHLNGMVFRCRLPVMFCADRAKTRKLTIFLFYRLMEVGDLRAVRGPRIDGFGRYLFSKDNVEAVRKQREAFKRKRAREGGSQRFGKPAGPRRSPVVAAITPRVKELMTEAAIKGTRISAATIHKQLMKEGYALGINSVYVCLRNARSFGLRSNKTGGALPQAPPSGYVSSPHATNTPTGEASAGA
jgi:hypothetical protein